MKNFKEINQLIEAARIQLKQEFFGIDEQIDSIVENIKPWLCFPEILTRPTIINLWGMTGCGKTSLINRVVDLLDLKSQYVYFNFAQLDEKSNWEIEDMLQENIADMDIKTPIFVYDEFQYAKTINEEGKELSKPALKIFWELLDSGKYINDFSYSDKCTIKKLSESFSKIINNDEIVIENGQIIEGKNHYLKITRTKAYSSTSWDDIDEEMSKTEQPTLFSTYEKEVLFKILRQHYPDKYENIESIYTELSQMNKKQIYECLRHAHKLALRNTTFDFSKSLIFVLGNLDEAYKMVYDSNPDMSPDQFHEMSKKISVVKIKNALQARFRIEQIARLGNIHLIYPSFSSQTFKKIIAKEIEEYIDKVNKLLSIELIIDESVYDIIYKDSVFPTHGARPLFTSIHEIIKTKLSTALVYAAENCITYDTIKYQYVDGYFVISYLKEGYFVHDDLKIEQKLRIENLRVSKLDDQQVITAVHEAGHTVVSIVLNKTIPNKVCSTSSDDSMEGFMLEEDTEDINSRNDTMNDIAVCLAGKSAEKFIFQDDNLITNGCSEDLSRATSIASYHIRKCGFGDFIANNGWMPDHHARDNKVHDYGNDCEIEKLLRECWDRTSEIFEEQETLLLKISEYLSTNHVMEKELIREFVDKYYVGEFKEKDEELYRNILKNRLNSLDIVDDE